MNIYFAGAIRGGREQQPLYQECVKILKKYGTVLGEHVAEDTLTRHGESEVDEQGIYEKEMDDIKNSDVVIAEVTTHSLGVGYIIAQAANEGKKVVCLYNGNPVQRLSAMIQGDKRLAVRSYQNVTDLEQIFVEIFKQGITEQN